MKSFRAMLLGTVALILGTFNLLSAPVATGCFSYKRFNFFPVVTDGYADMQLTIQTQIPIASGPFSSGLYAAFCADADVTAFQTVNYSSTIFSADDPVVGTLSLVQHPENLDLVEYILNQPYTSLGFTSGDLQVAIWSLLDGSLLAGSVNGVGPYDMLRVSQILADAGANGEGFVAGCGQLELFVVNPVFQNYPINTCVAVEGALLNSGPIAQPFLISKPVECPVVLECVSTTIGQVGNSYSSSLIATGGIPGYTYSIAGGALPTGLTLNPATGVITGNPTVAGTFNFAARAVDSLGNATLPTHVDDAACSITIESSQLTLACVAETVGTVGQPYASLLTAGGGIPSYNFSISAGALPPGLTLDSATGLISGVPSVAGPFAFTLVVTDSVGNTGLHLASKNCAITIGERDSKQYCALEAPVLNGDGSFTLSHALKLPGIGNDFIFGIAPGQFVDNGDGTATLTGNVYSRSNPTFGWQINVVLTGLVLPPASAPAGSPNGAPLPGSDVANWTYQTGLTGTLTGIGGYAGSVLSLTRSGPAWQEGVGANNKNLSYGASASVNVAVVQGGAVPSGVGEFNLNISTACASPAPLLLRCLSASAGTVGTPFSSAFVATGGVGPYTFSVISGLPPGLTLNPTSGLVSGTPLAAGTFPLKVQVVDAVGNYAGADPADHTASVTCTITVGGGNCTALTLGCVTTDTGKVGTIYSSNLQVTGGTAPYTFSIISGSLPAGLTLNPSTGNISGTPTTAGTFTFTAKVVDSSLAACGCNKTATVCCTIKIVTNCPPISLSCVSKNTGTVGTAYSSGFTVTGGVCPFTYAIVSGSLPSGLVLNANTGAVTGTPSAAGTFNFTVKVKGANYAACGCYGYDTVCCSITITGNCPPITLSCVSNGTGKVGTAYTGSFTRTGGVGPFTFSIVSGSLPPGLTLNATTGAVTGTPTAAGTFNFTAKVAGANVASCGCYGYDTVCCTIKIDPGTCTPPVCSSLVCGDTATIGYWQGPNGQALIKSLNGGANSTQLGNWLADNFPYLFGANAGADNLAGKSNTQVAAKFVSLFKVTGTKTKAQILATALAVYVTDSDLAGTVAKASGFNVSTSGTGAKCYNVTCYGSGIGLVNNKTYTVMALLKQADLRQKQNCFSSNSFNSIFDGINVKGDRN